MSRADVPTVTFHPDSSTLGSPLGRRAPLRGLREGAGFELYDLSGSVPGGGHVGATLAPRPHRPFAVIDLGSNTARLVIYHAAPVGPPWSVFESKEDPRLVGEIQKDGRLSEDGRRSGVATLQRFRRLLDVHGVRDVRAVATSAVREAPNRAAFVSEVHRRCSLRLRILSAPEEARYAFLGVASTLPLEDDLLMDLGGGSLQVMAVREGLLRESLSLRLGALRLHRKFLDHDPPKRKELEALEEHIEKALKPLDALDAGEDERVIGVGGTTRSLAHVMQATRGYPLSRVHGYTLRTRDLERLFDILSESSVAVRKEMPGLSADRADILVAGLAVVLGTLHRRDAEELTVSGCGIREGIAQETLDRPLPASVAEMARGSALATLWATGVDRAHAQRVRELSLEVFDLTRRRHEMDRDGEERLALEVASLLHDVGTTLSYPGHAAHSAYFLRSRPLYGLTHRGFLLASLAAGMSEGEDVPGGTIKRYPSVLEEDDVDVARRLGAMLALSEALGDLRPRPRFRVQGERLTIRVTGGTPPNRRLFDRASRWLKRSMDVEVHARPT
ncbi:MAG: Ppx/GppA family phosphatase [Euryarchaeota archaeon]|nr:Ppx/GppA family phosphatase [Euryarchaeota archaeon]MDE1837573.1 Ppx/GppA family phosphatase [Euryarchaeota archaeon]MDE1881312.1 Ppx/GppA family phosphatase [Euryarchaeota archaeon]MDE2045884.1 Ppx/GppA family phosphatase [Thermoplasmata archaeon]